MLGIYPFFMRTGYVGLSDAKYSFFMICSLVAIVLFFFTGFPRLISSITDKSFNAVHAAVFVFAVVSILSFSFSGYKDTALFGANEWYMGLVTILVLCAMVYLISILWKPNMIIVYGAVAVSAVVYILGIFDRFSLYIIPLSVRDPSFISTLGNINWFMGYYSIMTPLGVGLLMFDGLQRVPSGPQAVHAGSQSDPSGLQNVKALCRSQGMPEKRNSIKRVLLFLFVEVAFICGFAQGAESVFLVYAVMFVLLLVAATKKLISLQDLLILMIMWCLSAQVIRIIRMIFPQAYNYFDHGVCSYLTSNGITAAMAVIPAALLLIIYGHRDYIEKTLLIILWAVTAAGAIAYVVISLIKTNTDMLPGITNSVFFWDRRFGSGRGEAYRIAFSAISRMNFGQKLIGVGPDCFENFVYSIDEFRQDLYEIFNNSRLVNAHCSLLTLFINEGFLGVTAYTAIPVIFIRRVTKYILTGNKESLQASRKDRRQASDQASRKDRGQGSEQAAMQLGAPAPGIACERARILALSASLAIICAFTNDMISFTHILNVPFAAILIGMVLAFL